MAEQSFQEKTEAPTPRKREEARKKGEVAKGKEISSVAILSAGILYLYFSAGEMSQGLVNLIKKTFSLIPTLKEGDLNVFNILTETTETFLMMILPIFLVLCVVAVMANVLQVGLIFSVEPLALKPSKINPLSGLKKIISKRSLVELAKSVAKLLVVAWAGFSTLRDEFSNLIPLIYQGESQIVYKLGDASLKVVVKCIWVIALLAILDYFYQKWEFEEKLKMTKQEVKDEFKQTEGDPLIKSRIKSIQREMARRRMMEEVPKSDVVITNPVHFAVAISYESMEMAAPRVVAKGAEKIAFRIKEVAKEHNIPIVEDKPLAQNLYKLDLGEEIPSQFYQAVAEILAYVYKLKGKGQANRR